MNSAEESRALFDGVKRGINHASVTVGISEIANATGVSQTQLRYWEQKGYIKSIENEKSHGSHRYEFPTMFQVMAIKVLLDQGFTLSASVKKASQHSGLIRQLNSLIKMAFHGGAVIDGREMLNLGYFDEAKTKTLYGYIDDGEVHYVVKPAAES